MQKHTGAYVSEGNLVKFTARLVKEVLATAPDSVIMCNRDGKPAIYLEGKKTFFDTGSDCVNCLDPRTGEHGKFFQSVVAQFGRWHNLPI